MTACAQTGSGKTVSIYIRLFCASNFFYALFFGYRLPVMLTVTYWQWH
jgi:hypothetical protein